ncbi:anthranilate synthase component I family protein [Leucobacter massiliensis]|uniref:Chorismate-utilising enzyme C-terminal domain-containing protein n=1 Tax=Leucobacter massiliensis TaxID=1686285 RepID=A0A2S9QRP1_9MICO|nr:anthranilate synthase component I family protein [Leucobacter massiliensis]PRI12254.1 hypothetical protein B4915_04190 [Leucobacter massiliensis]
MSGSGLEAVDALAAARALAASGVAWCWLDGAGAPARAGAEGPSRVSYLGIASEVRTAERGREREFLADLRPAAGEGHGAPGGPGTVHGPVGFDGGWVVALGYEFGVALLGLDPAADDASPALALRLGAVLAVDHERGTAELRGEEAAARRLAGALGGAIGGPSAARAVRDPGSSASGPRDPGAPGPGSSDLGRPVARWRRSDAAYAAEVEACRAAIRDGEAYVLCLTDTAEAEGAFDPLALYERLRSAGAATRGGLIVAGERALVSASPERFLSLRGRRIATHPIKGTRSRGTTPAEDRALAAELAGDPKERAENLMIVDLMRNDLSRVCEPGSVSVEGFLRVETHAHVHQLVSTVSGTLRADADVFDAVEACFPGGSMTGAPKRRAVEILSELEAGPRGLYSGCFGWIGRCGDAELAMTIRGVELRGSRVLIGAGGGITADSRAASEVAEKHLKAAALLRGLGIADG